MKCAPSVYTRGLYFHYLVFFLFSIYMLVLKRSRLNRRMFSNLRSVKTINASSFHRPQTNGYFKRNRWNSIYTFSKNNVWNYQCYEFRHYEDFSRRPCETISNRVFITIISHIWSIAIITTSIRRHYRA